MTQILIGVAVLGGVVLVAVLITAGGVALIRRNRGKLRGSGSLGHAMQELEGLFVESKKTVIEAERHEEREAGDTGADPPAK